MKKIAIFFILLLLSPITQCDPIQNSCSGLLNKNTQKIYTTNYNFVPKAQDVRNIAYAGTSCICAYKGASMIGESFTNLNKEQSNEKEEKKEINAINYPQLCAGSSLIIAALLITGYLIK